MQENTTADQWKFLTTEQALEDVVYFADRFTLPTSSKAHNASVHPSGTPWIWLGGSYPGIRGAHMRVRNPETIYAAWASSAPVEAQVDMASYYKAAERSLTRNCSADWVAVTKYVDNTLANGTAAEQVAMKKRLLEAQARSPTNLTAMVSDEVANSTTNVAAAGVLMAALGFYQVRSVHLSRTAYTHRWLRVVLRLQRDHPSVLQHCGDAQLYRSCARGRHCRAGRC